MGGLGAGKWRDLSGTFGPAIWQLVRAGGRGGEVGSRKTRREAVGLGGEGAVGSEAPFPRELRGALCPGKPRLTLEAGLHTEGLLGVLLWRFLLRNCPLCWPLSLPAHCSLAEPGSKEQNLRLEPAVGVRASQAQGSKDSRISVSQTTPLSPQTTGHTTSRRRTNMSVRRECPPRLAWGWGEGSSLRPDTGPHHRGRHAHATPHSPQVGVSAAEQQGRSLE